ncbi:hypothetical protein K7X08_031632 [Anisodus acutangulus]|uniref:FCP1 homology domain-containing protein n=1 Tax=Anisodus acutangulus TaxID=402998 RepID=A0A9Q1RMB5_9SOLA|nr:hypothetical protein K7X08_031632 [Anisodus acutangulus]
MHSSRIVVQALPAPGAPDYWDTEKSKKSGTKPRKLNNRASFSRGKYSKDVDDLIPRQSKRIRNKQNRKIDALCLGAPVRIMNQENNSDIWTSDNIKSSTQVRSCIPDLCAWKVKKRRSILNSKSNSLENNVITCELENAASVPGKNHLDKGRSSEMGVNTCYKGDLVMNSSQIGTCPPKNTCDGVEETSRKNPSKSSGTDRDLETCSDRCSDISKDSESKSVSEVENQNEAVPNVDNSMTTESGDFVEVNNGAIKMSGLQIYPSLEVLITYSRKRRKNSSAPVSSLPSIATDATSSFPITENKTTTSSDHYQVSISYPDSLPEEVIAGSDTLLMGVQQMLLEKAAGDSSCTETWNKKETIQVDYQKENINSSMASIKDESPLDSKVENYELEKRNETDAAVDVSHDTEFAKESSHYAMPSHLRASSDTHSIVTTNEPLNGERQSANEDSSQSRASDFVVGRSQIANVGIIPPLGRELNARSGKKLLVLDVNGLLADIVPLRYVPYSLEANIIVSGKAVFKRPFHDDFLQFCFERFHVGVWSSRIKRNMELVLDFLLGDAKHKLLFCWDQSHCTDTGFPVVGRRRSKPIILKKLKKLWDKYEPDLPWERGEYDESNTLLLDDSPHKALCNPPNTAIFPNSYHYMDEKDDSLGSGGDLRVYLEGLSVAENVQKYVESNPFGQRPITEKNASWCYYRKVIAAATYLQESGANKYSTYKCRY